MTKTSAPVIFPTVTPETAAKTVYPGELVWFTPPVSGGKVAARLLDIDLESRTCKLEITATGNSVWPRGSVEWGIPFTRVFARTVTKQRWETPRFSLKWLDYPSARERAGETFKRLFPLTNK